MKNLQSARLRKAVYFTLVWMFADLVSLPVSAPAQAIPSAQMLSNGEPFLVAQTLRGRPVRRRGLASQGPCRIADSTSNGTLTSIVPRLDTEGLTVSAHPTFWVYVPYQANNFQSMSFVLKNSAGVVAYNPPLTAASTLPGIISLRLLESEAPLELNQKYSWVFTLSCGGTQLYVEGYVTRVSPSSDLQSALRAATTPEAQAAAYSNAGMWYDALTLLGDRRRAAPGNAAVTSAWANLLQGVDLSDISSKPMIN